MDNAADTKYTCEYVCNVINAATMEIKIVSKTTDAPSDLEICDVKVNYAELGELNVSYLRFAKIADVF